MDFNFLLDATKAKLMSGVAKGQLSGISTDTRKIKPGEVFFALKGENYDGHKFIREAFEKGASVAVVQKPVEIAGSSATVLKVESTLDALGDLAKDWRKKLSAIDLAAITGSNGKTTTKEMAWSIVSQNYNTLKNTGNFNNLIGLPLTLLDLDESYEMAVVELGMNEFGEISIGRYLREEATYNWHRRSIWLLAWFLALLLLLMAV